MATKLDTGERSPARSSLDAEFSARLEGALDTADAERRRRVVRSKAASAVPIVMLIGPLIDWKFTAASPGDEHVAVHLLVQLTFFLDAGVRVDTAVLSYLHLQVLPLIVGALILVLTSTWLLWGEKLEL